jgi:HTH-type transcriptional regulator, sugar sensing transcriptional regulator
MIVKKELVAKIKDYFGLNIYETKVWLALLSKGIASAGEIAELSGVPRSRTYDVLESLEKRGFAIVKLGKPVKYIGIKPNMILEKLKNNIRKDSEERLQGLGKIRQTEEFSLLEELYREGINPVKREDISAALKGSSNISGYLKDILREAKKEVIICTNAKDFSSKLNLFKQTIEKLKENNIEVLVALSGELSLIRDLSSKIGVKIKRVPIDAKFFIVDKKELLFYITEGEEKEEIAIWLNSDFFAQAFSGLFKQALE